MHRVTQHIGEYPALGLAVDVSYSWSWSGTATVADLRLANKGALTVTTVLETSLADPHAFPQCLLARCLPQREHDRQPCARRCRWTDARKRKVRKLAGPRNSRGKQSALPGQECWWSRLQKESSVFLSPLRLPLSFPRSLRRRGMQREPGGSGPKLKWVTATVAGVHPNACARRCALALLLAS
jgi:hypothetical protein